jgi:hypothetical protein
MFEPTRGEFPSQVSADEFVAYAKQQLDRLDPEGGIASSGDYLFVLRAAVERVLGL